MIDRTGFIKVQINDRGIVSLQVLLKDVTQIRVLVNFLVVHTRALTVDQDPLDTPEDLLGLDVESSGVLFPLRKVRKQESNCGLPSPRLCPQFDEKVRQSLGAGHLLYRIPLPGRHKSSALLQESVVAFVVHRGHFILWDVLGLVPHTVALELLLMDGAAVQGTCLHLALGARVLGLGRIADLAVAQTEMRVLQVNLVSY